ncbi:bidirectional sugar transporter SWEET6b-like [Chenopodium quinoa]|uniref:bidirectional sugar transporter SWEET6b-like n=1 Tax=Chenopodium quinoa TaxID=63459 RepID=UPI000B785737|nr:bidirectional sugar transporter SWEET6b-like [Chenopodium quinoa]
MVSPNAIRNTLGIIGNVISFGLFLSPVPTFLRIIKNKSVEEFKPDPYLCTVLNCLCWCLYGLPVVHPNNILVTTINGIGLGIELIYLVIFFIYASKPKRKVIALALLIEILLFAVILTSTLMIFHTTYKRTIFVGAFCVIFNVSMYFSPLTIMKKVVRTKSVEFMPFFLTLAGFLNGVCWTAYALIHIDFWMVIPNGLGAISGIIQLILYGTYYKSTPKPSKLDGVKPSQVELPPSKPVEEV